MNVSDARVLVTGGSGFLGRHVVGALGRRGCRNIVVVRKALTKHHRAADPAEDPAEGDHAEGGRDERSEDAPARQQGTVGEGGDPEFAVSAGYW